MRYRLGGDGSDGTIDCIHLVYAVLAELDIPTPELLQRWYDYPRMEIARALLKWGKRVDQPTYDGDVSLLKGEQVIFGVQWLGGVMVVSQESARVLWCPTSAVELLHTFRHYSRLSVT